MSRKINIMTSMMFACVSLSLVFLGIHNIDNAFNMANLENLTGQKMVDSNLFNTYDAETLHSMGMTLLTTGIIVFIVSALFCGYSVGILKV